MNNIHVPRKPIFVFVECEQKKCRSYYTCMLADQCFSYSVSAKYYTEDLT